MAFIKRLLLAVVIFFVMIAVTGFVAGVLREAVGQTAYDITIIIGVPGSLIVGILYVVKPGLFSRKAN